MDHDQQLSKMDPKLKEAYERVMGTNHNIQPPIHQSENTVLPVPQKPPDKPIDSLASAQQAINQAVSAPITPTTNISTPQTSPTNPSPLSADDRPIIPIQTPHVEMVKTTSFTSEPPLRRSSETVHVAASIITPHPVHKQEPHTEGMKRKSKTSPVIITILLLIFFSVYTYIWMIILAVPIPFISH